MNNVTTTLLEIKNEKLRITKERIAELELERLIEMGLFGDTPQFRTTPEYHKPYACSEQVPDNSEMGARLRNSSLLTC